MGLYRVIWDYIGLRVIWGVISWVLALYRIVWGLYIWDYIGLFRGFLAFYRDIWGSYRVTYGLYTVI